MAIDPAQDPAVEVGALASDREFASLGDAWRALEGRALAATPFASYDWIALCWAKLRAGPGQHLFVVTARENGRLVFVLPLAARRSAAGLRTLGWIDSGTPCYADLVMEDSAAGKRGAAAAAAFLKRDPFLRRMRLNWVPEDAAAGYFLSVCGARPRARFPVRRLHTGDYAGWDDFLLRMNPRSRQGFRRSLRGLEKLGPPVFEEVANRDEAEHEVALIFARKRAALGARLDSAHWLLSADVERLFGTAAATGVCLVYRLTLGGRTVAADLAFRSAKGLYLSKTAFDATLARYSPGKVCRLLLVKHALESGVEFIDLMTGRSAWKSSLSNRETFCANYRVNGRLFGFLPP